MNTDFSRPKVQQLFFCLYTRPLHPELFDTLACRRVQQDDYTLTVRITPSGHVLTWQTATLQLSEITASTDQILPRFGSRLRHRFQGERTGSIDPIAGVTYQMSSQLEILPPEIFVHLHDEILDDGAKRGLLFHHQPHHRLALSPLGYVTVQAWKNTLSVNTFHTFPNECALIKTQSLIERC